MSSAAGDREQKMLDSTTQNLSERLTEVRKTLGTLITKVKNKRCNKFMHGEADYCYFNSPLCFNRVIFITILSFQMETDPRLNWHSYLDSHALISGQLNSLLKSVKTPER